MKALTPARYRPNIRATAVASLLAAGLLAAAPYPARALDASGPAVTIVTGSDATAGDTRVLTDVRIAYPGENAVTIAIGKLTIKGPKQAGNGFQAGEVMVEKLVVSAPTGAAVEIPQATLRNVASPMVSAAALSAEAAPGHLPPLVTLLLAARADSVAVPQLIFRPASPSAAPLATYTNIVLDRLDGGKVASLGFDAFDSKAPDNTQLKAAKASIRDLDFGACAVWLDDALAAVAPPQMRPVFSSFELNDLAFAEPGNGGTVNRISGSDLKLAPPAMKPSDLAVLLAHLDADKDYAEGHPADMVKLVRTLLSAFTLGNLRMDGLVMKEDGKTPVSIGLIRAAAVSGSGVGEIRLGDVSGATAGEDAPFTLGSVVLRDFSVTDLDPLFDMLAAGGQAASLDEEQYPKIRASGFALADFSADMPDKGEVRVGSFTIDAPDWVGLLPSTLSIHLGGLSSPLANIDDAESRATFERLGIKLVEINADLDLAWKEADQTLNIGSASLDIGDFGKFDMNGTIGNLPRSMFVTPGKSLLTLFGIDFRGASLHAEDSGGFSRLITLSASDQKVTVQQLALGSTLLAQSELGAVLGDANAKKIGEAIQAFIVKPDALTIDVKTSKPLPIAPWLGGPATLGDSDRETIRNSVTIETKPE